jgi:hypothetical protein
LDFYFDIVLTTIDKTFNAFEDAKEKLGAQSKLETEANKIQYELQKKKDQMKEQTREEVSPRRSIPSCDHYSNLLDLT